MFHGSMETQEKILRPVRVFSDPEKIPGKPKLQVQSWLQVKVVRNIYYCLTLVHGYGLKNLNHRLSMD